jgi:hypothetical protein
MADSSAYAEFVKSSSVGNQDIHTVRDESGRITLSAASCDVLEKQVRGLSDWSTKLGDNHSPYTPCKCDAAKICRVDITNVVPDEVRKLQGFLPEYMGPNCWNASLVTGKIIPELRYADAGELTFWLTSPLCRERGTDEKPKAGDIIAVRDKNGVEQHSFIYVTDQLSFSKNGADKTAPYFLQSPEDVFFKYDVREGCRTGVPDPRCPNYANYYDCEPLDKYLHDRKVAPSQEFEDVSYQVCETEMELSRLSLYGGSDPKSLKNTIMNTIAALSVLSEQEVKKPHTPDEEFLWKSLTVRLDSTVQQMMDIK